MNSKNWLQELYKKQESDRKKREEEAREIVNSLFTDCLVK